MKKFMHLLARLFPNSAAGENQFGVKMFYRMASAKEALQKLGMPTAVSWPYYSGNYRVINPKGQIAICTLTSAHMLPDEVITDKIAIVGTLMTPNLGIEKIIRNVISNPNIHHLLICGKDSPIFKAGEALECLFQYGVDAHKRIIHSEGHYPVLENLSKENIDRFLSQVQLTSLKEEKQSHIIAQTINELKMTNKTFEIGKRQASDESFTKLKPGGRRIPLDYDKKGFFVISVDHHKKEITVKHYDKNNKPGHIITGRSSESILLAILQKDLVSQMSHAGYLGAELAKAETAIKLNLTYLQDHKLKREAMPSDT